MERANPRDVHRSLTQNVLSTGILSAGSRNLLRRANLLALYESDPVAALEGGHELLRERVTHNERRQLLAAAAVALAEASFLYASHSGDRRYFLAAAIYAWAYLFPEEPHTDPLDPRLRLAADLYNRALTLGVLPSDGSDIELQGGSFELPFGVVNVHFDESQLRWGARRFTGFASVSDLTVRGMRNRYRDAGLGAPFAAATDSPRGKGKESDLVHKEVRVPVALLLVFERTPDAMQTGVFEARLEVHPGTGPREVEIYGRRVALEMEPTATLALMMTETAPWRREIRGFFQGDLARTRQGIASMAPHQPGRIPVVLVHGTASSAATWANLLNDLSTDRSLSAAYEFWLFTYNTGAPVAYSAWQLRQAIDHMIETLDPDGDDPGLRHAVVIGHSQGGLLTKLMTVHSGGVFWAGLSDRPLDELDISEESREVIKGSLFVDPHPAVRRVVFIATPHRGSFLAATAPARWLGRFVRSPANVVQVVTDVVTSDPDAAAVRRIDDVDGALGNMSPTSPFLEQLVALPVAPEIEAHSIIPMSKLGPKEDGSDGVVQYESAHLAEVRSEVIVESGHSCLSHPDVISEVGRILRAHLLSVERELGP